MRLKLVHLEWSLGSGVVLMKGAVDGQVLVLRQLGDGDVNKTPNFGLNRSADHDTHELDSVLVLAMLFLDINAFHSPAPTVVRPVVWRELEVGCSANESSQSHSSSLEKVTFCCKHLRLTAVCPPVTERRRLERRIESPGHRPDHRPHQQVRPELPSTRDRQGRGGSRDGLE
eukprot:1796506-Rhodomonas_salina.2